MESKVSGSFPRWAVSPSAQNKRIINVCKPSVDQALIENLWLLIMSFRHVLIHIREKLVFYILQKAQESCDQIATQPHNFFPGKR